MGVNREPVRSPARQGSDRRLLWIGCVAVAMTIAASACANDAGSLKATAPSESPKPAASATGSVSAAQQRAYERKVQSDLRNALTAELVIYTDHQKWADSDDDFDNNGEPDVLDVEPALTWLNGATPATPEVVYVTITAGIIYLAERAKGASPVCFYLRRDERDGVVGYSVDVDCGPSTSRPYNTKGWGA